MNQTTDPRELVRRINEDEAVWQSYDYRRRERLRLGAKALLPEEVLDETDKQPKPGEELWPTK